MELRYTTDRNVQILLYLLKKNNIKKVVVSPGATHIAFIAGVQQDSFFEVYSEVDERSAAYMACGLAMESGEPVIITCTGATASRNYLPGLSEAYYRKLPILAITGAQDYSNSGNLIPQFIDRTVQPRDTVKLSVQLQQIKDERDEWDCNLKINKALLELKRHGGGPVHINLNCNSLGTFTVNELPPTRYIQRYFADSILPELPNDGKIAITVGGHKPWSESLTKAVDDFCRANNAVVLVDHSSNYLGKYRVLPTIASSQEGYNSPIFDIRLLIHIGEQSGDYYTFYKFADVKEVWRVSEDGELRDTFKHLSAVFEMREETFFNYYAKGSSTDETYFISCKEELSELYKGIPELPFSNIWLAKTMALRIPENSVVHFGVSNTQRAWTFFELPKSVISTANVGCRGIDGAISSALGMCLANPQKLHFCILGDLTFFYNMNALGNRHIGKNLRIVLVNNGAGAEFHLYQHAGYKILQEDVKDFVAAGGHFAQKSPCIVKHYAEDLGFRYLSASNKDELNGVLEEFLDEKIQDKPIILEVFTDCKDESDALKMMRSIMGHTNGSNDKLNDLFSKGKRIIKNIVRK